MLLSILIPVYNEEKTIAKLLKKVVETKLPKIIKKEIVLVDDGSIDKTVQIIQKELKEHKKNKQIKFIFTKHQENRGKGAAIRSAINYATGDILVVQDADLEYDPNDYVKLLEPIITKNAVVVYGTRLKNYPLKLWGGNKTVLPSHWIANKVLTAFTNLLYISDLTDMETCFKMFKKDVLTRFSLKANKFDIEPEITAKILKAGIKIYEVEIKTNPRTHREGKKIKWHDGVFAVFALIKYRFLD